MKTKTVSLNELAKELKAFSEKRIEELKEATLSGIAKSVPMLVKKSPVDTGLYSQSWGFTREEWGAIIGNYAPHSPIIEFGARPFTPPLGPLLAWAKRVLKDSSQPPEYSDKVWSLALGTQKKIQTAGMTPKSVLSSAIPEIIENIKEEYKRING